MNSSHKDQKHHPLCTTGIDRAVYVHMHMNNYLKKKYLKIASFSLFKLGGVNER